MQHCSSVEPIFGSNVEPKIGSTVESYLCKDNTKNMRVKINVNIKRIGFVNLNCKLIFQLSGGFKNLIWKNQFIF